MDFRAFLPTPSNKDANASKVYFNHFEAIKLFIGNNNDRYKLKEVVFFNELKILNPNFQLDKLKKLLWNAWSTEYALKTTRDLGDTEYYKFSLHWTFPQAYYSVYLAMTAFHEILGVANDNHEKSIKLFGNSIKDNHYPSAISFFSSGLKDDFKYNGLPNSATMPNDFSVLSKIHSLEEAEYQIMKFLKSTREKNSEKQKERVIIRKDRNFLTKTGKPRKKFDKRHWDLLYNKIPQTTILNILYRLRIKANYHDIESFINADIDFKKFHDNLSYIVDYINFVHEAYIAKAIGLKQYQELLEEFPSGQTAKKRLIDGIEPLFL